MCYFGGAAIRIRAHETVLALFHALLDVFKALTGGPNTKNRVPTALFATDSFKLTQVRLLSGDTPVVLGKLLYVS